MILFAALSLAAACYYVLVLVAAALWPRTGKPGTALPAVSILKPVCGRDPRFYEAICSHALQDYPRFEILFGVHDAADPALSDIRRLIEEFPARDIQVLIGSTRTPNAKVGLLAELAARARYDVLLVNDSDILVEPDYLATVVAPLEDPGVGVVTCLYRAGAESAAGRWEALGVATEFVPSVLVARLIGVVEFALGSTMVVRRGQLDQIGGFAALSAYLADDYQLGRRITGAGYRVAFAPAVVETSLGRQTWRGAWKHQLRWSRTIRVSRRGGYCGYVVTHATLWAVLAMAAGAWRLGLATLAIRVAAGVVTSLYVLRDRAAARRFFLIPLRDLWGFALWICGLFGRTVEWRGQTLRLLPDGRIHPEAK